jgi:hypothetical protein
MHQVAIQLRTAQGGGSVTYRAHANEAGATEEFQYLLDFVRRIEQAGSSLRVTAFVPPDLRYPSSCFTEVRDPVELRRLFVAELQRVMEGTPEQFAELEAALAAESATPGAPLPVESASCAVLVGTVMIQASVNAANPPDATALTQAAIAHLLRLQAEAARQAAP